MERQCVAVKLPLFFAEMLFEQKKRRSLKSCKTDDFGTKTQKFICPLQLVLALGALEPSFVCSIQAATVCVY